MSTLTDTYTLSNGVDISKIGLGTWMMDDGAEQGISVDVDALEWVCRVGNGDLTWEQARAQVAAKYGPEHLNESSRRARRSSSLLMESWGAPGWLLGAA